MTPQEQLREQLKARLAERKTTKPTEETPEQREARLMEDDSVWEQGFGSNSRSTLPRTGGEETLNMMIGGMR